MPAPQAVPQRTASSTLTAIASAAAIPAVNATPGASPAPAVHCAHADREQRERPGDEDVEEPRDGGAGRVSVAAAGAEEIAAVDGDPNGPVDEERERDRRRCERKRVACAPEASAAAELPQCDVRDLAHDVVEEEPVETSGQECPHRSKSTVDLDVVEQRARDGRREDGRDARKPDEPAGRVLPVARRLVGVVTERSKDGTRALQDEQRPQEPRPLFAYAARRLRLRRRFRGGAGYARASDNPACRERFKSNAA